MPTLLRTNKEIMEIYDRQVDTVYRVCYAYMKNAPEAEDMTQETFLRLMSNGKPFADQRHEKAWLIITASNLCKDTLKKWWRKNENIDDYTSLPQERTETGNDVLDAILAHFPPVSGELTDEEQWNAALAMTSALPQRLFTADYERMVEEEETPSVKA